MIFASAVQQRRGPVLRLWRVPLCQWRLPAGRRGRHGRSL